tara:strand:- start:12814 stop:13506 length:693 start_codon:yes stop_codon:yes gene_type:complete
MPNLTPLIGRFHDDNRASNNDRTHDANLRRNAATLLVTCSDASFSPNTVTQSEPDDYYILRSVGNIVPPQASRLDNTKKLGGDEALSIVAALEYAVTFLRIARVIVCGHSDCAVMEQLLNPTRLAPQPNTKRWLAHTNVDYRLAELDRDAIHDDRQRLDAVVEENVLVQMANLMSHPFIANAIAHKKLEIVGWTYRTDSNKLLAWEQARLKFVPMERTVRPAKVSPKQVA